MPSKTLNPAQFGAIAVDYQCYYKVFSGHSAICMATVMDIGYFSIFLNIFFSLYLLDKETQCNTYLNPCSEFILNFLDIIYSQMTPFRKQSFLLKLEPLSF